MCLQWIGSAAHHVWTIGRDPVANRTTIPNICMFALGVGFRDVLVQPTMLDFLTLKRTAARRHEANSVRRILPVIH